MFALSGGIACTLLIALAGFGLSMIPGFDRIGPLACTIFLAVAYRSVFGYPEALRPGLQFAAKKLLRFAIILYGLKLNIGIVLSQGLGLLLLDAAVVLFAILLMQGFSKQKNSPSSIPLLLGVGTGVCGAAAIAAVSPIIRAKDEDTAVSVGMIALVGTCFALLYTFVRPYLPLSDAAYGVWSGISLHELANVALAAAPAGEDAVAMALLAKLGRVLLLVPLCLIIMYMVKRKGSAEGEANISFPWFLPGFLAMSLFGTYVLGTYIPVTETFQTAAATVTTFILTMAMAGMGLDINLRALGKAGRPLAAMVATSVLLSGLSLVLIAFTDWF